MATLCGHFKDVMKIYEFIIDAIYGDFNGGNLTKRFFSSERNMRYARKKIHNALVCQGYTCTKYTDEFHRYYKNYKYVDLSFNVQKVEDRI